MIAVNMYHNLFSIRSAHLVNTMFGILSGPGALNGLSLFRALAIWSLEIGSALHTGLGAPDGASSRLAGGLSGKKVFASSLVTVPSVTLARKVSPGLQDLQTQARRILAERNAEKAEENTWIGRMVAAENINDMKALIKSHDSA